MKDLVNQDVGSTVLVAAPSSDTLTRLQDILSGSPIQIDWDHLCLQIAASDYDVKWEAKSGAKYAVKFVSFGISYDEDSGHSMLTGVIESPEVFSRGRELGMASDYQACVVFNAAAQLARTNKSFISSVSTTLCAKEDELFTFGPELVARGG